MEIRIRIITYDEKDIFESGDYKIYIKPFWEWVL